MLLMQLRKAKLNLFVGKKVKNTLKTNVYVDLTR